MEEGEREWAMDRSEGGKKRSNNKKKETGEAE